MAQVQYLLPAAPHVPAAEEDFPNTRPSATYYVPPPALTVDATRKNEDKVVHPSSLPTPPSDDLEAGEFPSYPLFVTIPGLPYLSAGPSDQLMRERILQATFEADMSEGESDRAFFVADLGKVYKQFTRWRRCLPDVEPFYAVKCNPDPFVLRLLASLGTGFDCASRAEIQQVLDIAVDPSRIIFANPCKPLSFIRKACKAGVDMMTFDNTDELCKIARSHRGARLVVRILTDDSKSLCRLGLKFGAPLATVPRLLDTARELGLDVIGVSFHVGSGCYDANAFDNAVSLASEAFRMGITAGYRFTLLDVGGGFESHNFEQTAAVLARAIQTYFPRAKQQGMKIIAEPGRYFVSEAYQLAANVIARRVSPPTPAVANDSSGAIEVDGIAPATGDDNKGHEVEPSVMYYINDGVYGSFNCIMFDHQKVTPYPLTIGRSLQGALQPACDKLSSVWGPTCDSIDCVAPLCMLPESLIVGDWLGFDNMGAYTVCAASTFNGFQTSEIQYTSGANVQEGIAVHKALSKYNVAAH